MSILQTSRATALLYWLALLLPLLSYNYRALPGTYYFLLSHKQVLENEKTIFNPALAVAHRSFISGGVKENLPCAAETQ